MKKCVKNFALFAICLSFIVSVSALSWSSQKSFAYNGDSYVRYDDLKNYTMYVSSVNVFGSNPTISINSTQFFGIWLNRGTKNFTFNANGEIAYFQVTNAAMTYSSKTTWTQVTNKNMLANIGLYN